jgi:hypothetical protein
MGISDYDLHIKSQDFRISELIYETAQLGIQIAKLNSHIQVLETTLAAMSGELHALRMDTQ